MLLQKCQFQPILNCCCFVSISKRLWNTMAHRPRPSLETSVTFMSPLLKKKKIEFSFKNDFNQLWTAAASFLNVRKRLWNTMAHCQSNFNNASHHGWLILNQSRHRVRVCRTVLHCYVFCPFCVRSWLSFLFCTYSRSIYRVFWPILKYTLKTSEAN